MLRDLLRQLFTALTRYVSFNTRRLLHLPQKPQHFENAVQSSRRTATPDSIKALSDGVGLAPAYTQLVPWPPYRQSTLPAQVLADPLFKIWKTIPDGHKWTHYFEIYSEVFGARRTEPLRILEIGVSLGASLKLWRKYFSNPKTLIVGIDILPACAKFDAPDQGMRVKIGSQTDAAFLRSVVQEFGPFDIIIDDGSHVSSHIIETFNVLFSDGLKDTGIYFVEDLHANYWHPWRDSRKSFLDVCKELVELMHAHYQSKSPDSFLLVDPARQDHTPLQVPLITTLIKEIRFFDSIVAIHKARLAHVPHHVTLD